MGGCYPSYYLGSPQPLHTVQWENRAPADRLAPRGGSGRGKAAVPGAEVLREAGSSSAVPGRFRHRFQAAGPELQRYRQPVILFKQPLLFGVAGLVILLLRGLQLSLDRSVGDRQAVTLTSGLLGTHPRPREAPSVAGLRPTGLSTPEAPEVGRGWEKRP